MSILENGLPKGLLTRWGAVATGMAIAGAVIVAGSIYSGIEYFVTEPDAAPICFETGSRHHVAGNMMIPAYRAKDASGHSIDDRLRAHDLERLVEAQTACTSRSCNSAAWKKYRSALFWYVSNRTHHVTRLDADYGDAGLARARKIYGTRDDLNIEIGLRNRYNAGVFRLNDFRQYKDAIAILTLKGGEALLPCRSE